MLLLEDEKSVLDLCQTMLKRLFMSGYPENVISSQGTLVKDLHYLQKPFRIHDLANKVRDVLDHGGVRRSALINDGNSG